MIEDVVVPTQPEEEQNMLKTIAHRIGHAFRVILTYVCVAFTIGYGGYLTGQQISGHSVATQVMEKVKPETTVSSAGTPVSANLVMVREADGVLWVEYNNQPFMLVPMINAQAARPVTK